MDAIEKGFQGLWDKLSTWVVLFIEAIPNILIAVVVFIGFIFISSWVYGGMKRLFGRTHLNPSLEQLLAKVVKVIVMCLGAVLALSILQLDKVVFSMLAGVGVIGLALGFAFQDLAANFISGLILAVRSPFKVGDVIEINSVRGTIVDIRLRDTVLKNFGGQHIFIPNKEFTTNRFMNFSSFGVRKVEIKIGVSYDDDLKAVKQVILDRIQTLEGITQTPAPLVVAENFGASSIGLSVEVWVTYPGSDVVAKKDELIVAVKEVMDENGYSIPYDIRTLTFSPAMESALTDKMLPNSKDEIAPGYRSEGPSV